MSKSEQISEDELNHLLLRSSAGGKHTALSEVVGFLRRRSGEAFAGNRDEEAKTLRELSHIFLVWKNEASSALDKLNEEPAK